MANQEHLDILKQGVEVWNKWRREHKDIRIDFTGADLSASKLSSFHLIRCDLCDANLSKSNLASARLSGSNLQRADLTEAILVEALLVNTDLSYANLAGASLNHAQFLGAKLDFADLRHTDLTATIFNQTSFIHTDLSDAEMLSTIFGVVSLRTAKGLHTIRHTARSIIDIDTVYLSQGKIPEVFLKGIGVPDFFITYARSLVRQRFDFYSCFISYSSKDQAFAQRLHFDLQAHGVRCWFAPEDMKIGDRIRTRIDDSIHTYDKLLIVLSENSVASKWVEFEVEAAMDKEQDGEPTVLFPVRLDNAVMNSGTAWAKHIKRTRHIGDFTRWKDHDAYQIAFERLLRDLKSQ